MSTDDAPAPAPAAESPTRRRDLLQLLRGGPFGGADAMATGGAPPPPGGGASAATTTALDEAAAAGNHVGLLGRLAGITLPPITVRVQPTAGKAPSAAPTPAPAPAPAPPRPCTPPRPTSCHGGGHQASCHPPPASGRQARRASWWGWCHRWRAAAAPRDAALPAPPRRPLRFGPPP